VQPRHMKKLGLAAILVAACASSNIRTSDSDPRLAQFEKKRRAVAESERQCIAQTLTRSRDENARIAAATPDASVESQTEKENYERERAISQCRATANNENARISDEERKEYELQAQEERDRASLMATLTTSRHP
jgi:hypothetical protein